MRDVAQARPRPRRTTTTATRAPPPPSAGLGLAGGNYYDSGPRHRRPAGIRDGGDYDDGYYDDDDFYYDDDGFYDDGYDDGYDARDGERRSVRPERPGRRRDADSAEPDAVASARLYFASASVRKRIVRKGGGARGRDGGDGEGGFYRVVEAPPPGPDAAADRGRTQVKLSVAPASAWDRAAGCTIGPYRRGGRSGSGEVLPTDDRVHHPAVDAAIDALTKATQRARTPGYADDAGEGLLRYAECQVEASTGKVRLILVMHAERFKDCQPHLSYLVKELRRDGNAEGLWHSIWCHCNDSKVRSIEFRRSDGHPLFRPLFRVTNDKPDRIDPADDIRILRQGDAVYARDASRWHPVDGPPFVRESIPGSDPNAREGLLYFSPSVRQGSAAGYAAVAREVREAMSPGSRVCALNAGVGLLGLSALLHHGKRAEEEEEEVGGAAPRGGAGLGWLRCSDESAEAARCFDLAVRSMPARITGRDVGTFRKGGKKGKKTKKGGGNNRRRGRKRKPGDGGEVSIKDLMDSMMAEEDGGAGGARPPEGDPEERVTYTVAHAASALYRGEALGADVLVVDPPRRGLDDAVLRQLCLPRNSKQPYAEKASALSHLPRHAVNWTNDVRTLIYVGSGFDALARDLDQMLTSSSGWKLESATGHVLFPGSNHVETVVVMRR